MANCESVSWILGIFLVGVFIISLTYINHLGTSSNDLKVTVASNITTLAIEAIEYDKKILDYSIKSGLSIAETKKQLEE